MALEGSNLDNKNTSPPILENQMQVFGILKIY